MTSPKTVVRLLVAASVLLALGCVGLAFAWTDERARAECWREAFESSEVPPEGVC